MRDSKPILELVLPRSNFERLTAELSLGPRAVAALPIMINRLFDRVQLLANRAPKILESTEDLQGLPASIDHLIMETSTRGIASNPVDLISQCQPSPGQIIGLLQTGVTGHKDSWRCLIAHNQNLYPIHRLRLIGPGMLTIDRNDSINTEDSFTLQEDSDTWSRFRGAIGNDVLNTIHNSSVLLFGAGKIGSLVAMNLVMMGIQKLTIVDFDRLEPSNLFATFGATKRDVGEFKSVVLTQHLSNLSSHTTIHGLSLPVHHPGIVEKARGVDLIIDCVDTDTPRVAASQLCNQLLKVNLSLGTIVRHVQHSVENATSQRGSQAANQEPDRELGIDVKLLLPGTCHLCATGITALQAAEVELRSPPMIENSVNRPAWNATARIGSLATLNLIAAGSGLQLWFDLLGDKLQHSLFIRNRWIEGRGLRQASSPVIGREHCRLCGHLFWQAIRNESDRERVQRLREIVSRNGH